MSIFGNNPKQIFRAITLATTLGTQFAASVFVGFWLGNWGDGLWGTAPWMMILGVLLGTAAGVMGMIRMVGTFFKQVERKGNSSGTD